jgi:hypothetical protein
MTSEEQKGRHLLGSATGWINKEDTPTKAEMTLVSSTAGSAEVRMGFVVVWVNGLTVL